MVDSGPPVVRPAAIQAGGRSYQPINLPPPGVPDVGAHTKGLAQAMKKLLPILTLFAAVIFAGCGTLRSTATPGVINTPPFTSRPDGLQSVGSDAPQPGGGFLADAFAKLVERIRLDFQSALDGAVAGGDPIGVQCHTDGLAFLNRVTAQAPVFVHVKVAGIASAAEAVRVKEIELDRVRASFDANKTAFHELRDKCAAVYPAAQMFGPMFRMLQLIGF